MRLKRIFDNGFVLVAQGFVVGAAVFLATTPIGSDSGPDAGSVPAAAAAHRLPARG